MELKIVECKSPLSGSDFKVGNRYNVDEFGFIKSGIGEPKYSYDSVKDNFKEYSLQEATIMEYQEINRSLVREVDKARLELLSRPPIEKVSKQIATLNETHKNKVIDLNVKIKELEYDLHLTTENYNEVKLRIKRQSMEIRRLNLYTDDVLNTANEAHRLSRMYVESVEETLWFKIGKFLRFI